VPERITSHNARVAYPAWLDARTLIYSATAEDGSGQWLYAVDVEHRHPAPDELRRRCGAASVGGCQSRATAACGRHHRHPTAALWAIPLRFFAGLDIDEAAEALGISTATVEREWAMAKAWLHRQLSPRE
jgi:hypothetical protein